MREELTQQFGPDVAHAALTLVLAHSAEGMLGLALTAEIAVFICDRQLNVDALNAALLEVRKNFDAYQMAGNLLAKASELSKKLG